MHGLKFPLRAGVVLGTAMAVVLPATALPAAAASAPAPAPQAVTSAPSAGSGTASVGWLSADERKALDPFVHHDGDGYRLDVAGARAAGVDQRAVDATRTAVDRLDTLVDKKLAVSQDGEGVVVDPAAAGVGDGSTRIAEGISVKVTWFGLLIHLDPFVTSKVQAGVDITKDLVRIATGVVSIASLGSLLPVALLASAMADLGSKVVSFCTTRKGELYVYVTWAGVPVCNPFA
ncbi:hypothetical protein [Streptomyces hesseae]|uniref:Uncharacterized protein n=1 Tax=Streptomyces hesseae TaxID=3075519 RepID=A0ABU2SHT5_9ACTN|nr:hypothetical protein [Streptomyces sp. DSM 40473]MDT0448536.1 hypothetical protein [Streptomyces sp. DSM 40473]